MIDAKMFSLPWKRLFKKFATISLQVVIIFLTNSVIIVTTKTLKFSLIYMYLKDKRDDHHTLTPVCIVHRFRFFVRFFFFVSEPQSPSYLNLVTFYKLACSAGVLLGRVNVKKFAIIYSAHHVWFGDWGSGGRRGLGKGEKTNNIHSPTPTPILILDRSPLDTNFLSPQHSAAIQ